MFDQKSDIPSAQNKVIAILSKDDSVRRILDAARLLLKTIGGSGINAVFVRYDPHTAVAVEEDDYPHKEQENRFRDQEKERCRLSLSQYNIWIEEHKDVPIIWNERKGKTEAAIADLITQSSCIIVARPDLPATIGEHEALLASVFASTLPVIVIPAEATSKCGKRIALHWSDNFTAARNLQKLLTFFPDISELHVMFCGSGATGHRFEHGVIPGHVIVREHYISHDESYSFGNQLLLKASNLHVDLIVAEAKFYNNWHILLFEDVTKVLLDRSNITLLLHCAGPSDAEDDMSKHE